MHIITACQYGYVRFVKKSEALKKFASATLLL